MIGQFSKISGVSKRMLRHYEEKGLIQPYEIDDFTGYRYYSESQLQLIDNILLLQSFGFSLSEIKSLMTKPLSSAILIDALKDKEVILRSNKDEIAGQLIRLQQSIEILSNDTNNRLLTLEALPLERNILMKDKTQNIQTAKETMLALPSYSLFFEYISDYLEAPTGDMYFLTFDLDNFLRINDRYGFDAGDKTIYQTCALIHSTFRDLLGDKGIMARLGGDEFALFLHDVNSLEYVETTVKQTLDKISTYDYSIYGSDSQITSSCGIYVTSYVNNVGEFRHESTKALMDSKRNGRNQFKTVHKKQA